MWQQDLPQHRSHSRSRHHSGCVRVERTGGATTRNTRGDLPRAGRRRRCEHRRWHWCSHVGHIKNLCSRSVRRDCGAHLISPGHRIGTQQRRYSGPVDIGVDQNDIGGLAFKLCRSPAGLHFKAHGYAALRTALCIHHPNSQWLTKHRAGAC